MTAEAPARRPGSRIVLIIAFAAFLVGGAGGWLLRGGGADDIGRDDSGNFEAIARAWGGDLYVRNYPGRVGYFEGTIPYGNRFVIECSVTGEQVTWNDLSTDTWFRLDNGNFTTAAYTDLVGSAQPPACEDELAAPPATDPRETAYAEVRTNLAEYPLYDGPSADGDVDRYVPNNSALTLLCYEFGPEVPGFFEPSDLWFEVDGGGWANDGDLITGVTGGVPPVFPCA